MSQRKITWGGVSAGAAFLMAVSAIGPGFLTQTTTFTKQLGASLAFAILVSILIDIGAQLNTWRIICVSGKRGHEVADAVIPGMGAFVAAVIVIGSFIFNLGNFSGCALGFQVLFNIPLWLGATLSALVAVVLFLMPRMLSAMDGFSKLLGVAMIAMTLYIVVVTQPPIGEAFQKMVMPDFIDPAIVVTLVGGTIGGYIMFSGAHRLLDGGVRGVEELPTITWASIQGILITGTMRLVLFLAVLGVVAGGAEISNEKPVFDAFEKGAGHTGLILSGLIFWFAAITSVVGCSYTAISFLVPPERTGRQGDIVRNGDLAPEEAPTASSRLSGQALLKARPYLIVGFILLSLAVMLAVGGEPTDVLIWAGTINGILLPVVFGAVLLGAWSRRVVGEYRHPWWAGAIGIAAWLVTVYLAYMTALAKFGS